MWRGEICVSGAGGGRGGRPAAGNIPVALVRIKVSKPGAVARAANVGVIIERGLNLKQNFSGHTC